MKFEKSLMAASLSAALFLGACVGGESKPEAPPIPTPNIVTVPASGDKNQDDAAALNAWAYQHIDSRIVAFTGLLAYRSENSAYELVTEPGNNNDERFDFVEADDGDLEEGKSTSAALQKWVDANPERKLIGLASIPAYGGGAEGYIMLSAPRDENR